MSEPTRPITSSHGYWQSLEELAADSSFVRRLEQEFPDESSDPVDGVSRRRVLQLMSASVALAGLSGCRWPEEEIIPFDRRPESYQPGKLERYATTLEIAGVARPVLVSSFDGRPIKIEGNPDHPLSAGAANALTQASILELYDRDRSRQPRFRQHDVARRATWQELEAAIPNLISGQGNRAAVLSQPLRSPSLERAALRLQARFPGLQWYEFAAGFDTEQARGLESVFGQPVLLGHDLEKARMIVDFDSDLLMTHPEGVRTARGFALSREPDPATMSRLYVFESLPSSTGAAADHRVPLAPSLIVPALGLLAGSLGGSDNLARPDALAGFDASSAERALNRAGLEGLVPTLEAVADDLLHNPGQAVVALGDRHPAAAHVLVHRINLALGNNRGPVRYRAGRESSLDTGTLDSLTQRLDAGEIDCLLILEGNPVYDAPGDLGFAEALAKVDRAVHVGLHDNETAAACRWHLPMAHGLESWGDLWDLDGRLCAVQPLIRPLFGGRTPAEVLSMLADAAPLTSHEMAQQTLARVGAGSAATADKVWRRYLHDGFFQSETSPVEPAASLELADWADLQGALDGDGGKGGLELDLRPAESAYDGRYANNAWLQELPNAISKLTWGNAALLGPSLADEMGVEHEDVVRLETTGSAIELPVFVLPGMAKGTVSVALGYGRTRAGRVGTDVGVDAYAMQTWNGRWSQSGVTMTPMGRKGPLASTQNHYAIDSRGKAERERRIDGLVREGTLTEFEHHPEFAQHMGVHHPPLKSLWEERIGEGHQWGMAIDLNACIACNSCVVACQAENNIPVVGKEAGSQRPGDALAPRRPLLPRRSGHRRCGPPTRGLHPL